MLMTKTSMAAMIPLLLFSGAAAAQGMRLSAEGARTELFGVELAGVNDRAGDAWSECIEPGGRTVYRRFGETVQGRLAITNEGLACFAYEDTNYERRSCFVVERRGQNYRLDAFVTQPCGAA